jgi:hypothetical protein
MPYNFYIWTPEIVEHLAEHGITPDEFEEVVRNPETEDVSHSSGNPIVFGTTSEGRRICCVFKRLDQDTIERVTAYEVE